MSSFLQSRIAFKSTGDPEFPYEASVGAAHVRVRINDFPAEEMYTLIVDGEERESFSDWPANWVRPDEDAA
jgi:hypothetical protein